MLDTSVVLTIFQIIVRLNSSKRPGPSYRTYYNHECHGQHTLAGSCHVDSRLLHQSHLYRLLLHPLAKFPGPKLADITRYYEGYYDVVQNGQYTIRIAEMHKQYGTLLTPWQSSDIGVLTASCRSNRENQPTRASHQRPIIL